MNITSSVASERDRALLGGDYNAYHAQATRKIHNFRKRLGIANRGRKYTPKSTVTAENVAKNIEWIHLLLASSERAWADAMAMKSAQSAENTQKPMPGTTKRQIASRLRRAILYAENLVDIVQDRSTTGATELDDLEARAYVSMLRGSLDFEKARWQACLEHYSVCQVVYTVLARTSKTDVYKDLLGSIVEPSIRYAAYQLKMPRTRAIDEIAVEAFPSSEEQLRKEVEKVDPQAFLSSTAPDAAATSKGPKEIPSTISWGSRTVQLEDATISQALGVAKELEDELARKFQAYEDETLGVKDLATAYEEVITATQDAADATKTALDELAAEGADPGDARMQSLQITRTAVNYAVIEWRIGRNRVLCGGDDGLLFGAVPPKQPLRSRKDGKDRTQKPESSARRLARLRERVALYNSILQSLDAVKELPGVIADAGFVGELDAKRSYFRALKCLAIGRSHAINDQIPNALALYARALELAQGASTALKSPSQSDAQTPKIDVSVQKLEQTRAVLGRLVTQYRALAQLKVLTGSNKKDTATNTAGAVKPPPLIERLRRNEYVEDVDLSNLVNYPPTLRPVPVKPLFFDLAWNYIHYPSEKGAPTNDADSAGAGQTRTAGAAAVNGTSNEQQQTDKSTKRGWFGFGR